MTPIELLEHGIKTGDWEAVCHGFSGLTGRVAVGSPPAGNPDRLREALEWYARKENYSLGAGAIPVMLDCGQKAREALGEGGGGTPVPVPDPKTPKLPAGKRSAKPPKPPKPPKKLTPVAAAIPPGFATTSPGVVNLFVDDGTEAAGDITATRWVNENARPVARRPPHNDPPVKVRCDGEDCGREFQLPRSRVRVVRGGDAGDVGTQNFCPKCCPGGTA